MGITQRQIDKLRKQTAIGSNFNYKGVRGRVCEKYKNFVVIEKPQGYKECFRWSELLTSDK